MHDKVTQVAKGASVLAGESAWLCVCVSCVCVCVCVCVCHVCVCVCVCVQEGSDEVAPQLLALADELVLPQLKRLALSYVSTHTHTCTHTRTHMHIADSAF